MPIRSKKILVITGTRAEYGLLKPIIEHIISSRVLELRILVTGMHTLDKYGKTIRQIRADNIPIHCVVHIAKNDSMLTALAKEILGIEKYCLANRPDIILVLGDRDEALAGAVVGGHLRIAIAHINGGDTTGYIADEAIRHSITKFANIHFPSTKKNYNRILKLGEEKWRVYLVGSTAFDIQKNDLRNKAELASEFGLDMNLPWILIIQHPTPLDSIPFKLQIQPTIRAVQKFHSEKIFIYNNSDTGSEIFISEIESLRKKKNIKIFKSLPRPIYLSFLKNSDILVGNSSSGIIESTYFRLPTINIGNRQKGRECGQNVMHAEHDQGQIEDALATAVSERFINYCRGVKNPYGNGGASKKITRILEQIELNDKIFYKKF